MTLSLSTLKTSGKAALVALTLGVASMSAMPAQAANFQLQLGNGPSFNPGFGNGGITLNFGGGNNNNYNYCLSDSQVRAGVRHQGYDDVRIVKVLSSTKVVVVGEKWGKWYQMRVNRCTGVVDHVERIRRNNNGSFSITLNF